MNWRSIVHKNQETSGQKRIKILVILFLVFAVLIVLRLFNLQILRGGFYSALASGQHDLYQKLFPERGSIFIKEKAGDKEVLYPLVSNRTQKMLYVVPRDIEDASATAQTLFDILGYSKDFDMPKIEAELFADISSSTDPKLAAEIKQKRLDIWWEEQKRLELENNYNKLNKPDDPYEPIRPRITDEQYEALKKLNIKGLGYQDREWRYYPEKNIGGQIFGYVSADENDGGGKYGLEGYFDDVLSGKMGEIYSERDAFGNLIAIGKSFLKPKEDGADLVLTLDRAIQYKTCAEIKAMVESSEAKQGTAIVMNPKTGAILAMCSWPDYNPEEYYKVEDINIFNNPAIFASYEPGSIFKTITMAAALDAGKVEPETTYVDTGMVAFGSDIIRNFANLTYGKMTMTQVLEFSINTGVIFAMRQITPPIFAEYVKKFNFGKPFGIELGKEMSGDIRNLDRKAEIYSATATFGQGITVTPLQMIAAVAAIANGGKMMKPYIVSQIIRKDGVENFLPQEIGQPISSVSAAKLAGMMVSVTENGHAKKAQIPGYHVAGKTGTAQVPRPGGGYKSEDSIIGSFVGFSPFADPAFVMLVRVDEPVHGKVGETVAAPVFKNVGQFILQYYNIPYDRPDDPALKKGN